MHINPSPAAALARSARIAASDYAALQFAMRRKRYYPSIAGAPLLAGSFTTADRPMQCKRPNAGAGVTYTGNGNA